MLCSLFALMDSLCNFDLFNSCLSPSLSFFFPQVLAMDTKCSKVMGPLIYKFEGKKYML